MSVISTESFDFDNLVCDIEGTVTSISFVKDELFPYAASKVTNFLTKHQDRKDVREVMYQLIEASADEAKTDDNIKFVRPDELIEDLSRHVRYWIEHDKKLTALKALQGLMWEEAYKAGEIKGHVYPEVAEYFKKITKDGKKKIWIYSSGSIKAQKLLFQHSTDGDLTPFISGYFDTTTGNKQNISSYLKIAAQLGGDSRRILFLTDIEEEARAARAAGMNVIIMVRPGNKPLSEEVIKDFPMYTTIDTI